MTCEYSHRCHLFKSMDDLCDDYFEPCRIRNNFIKEEIARKEKRQRELDEAGTDMCDVQIMARLIRKSSPQPHTQQVNKNLDILL